MAKTLYNNTVNVGAYSSSGTLYSDYYSMALSVVENDYNINTNKSPIVLTAKFRNNKNWQAWSGYSESNCPKFTLTLYDNKTETTRTYNYYLTALNAKQEVTIFEKTLDLEHNSDGNLKISVTLSVERQSQVYYFPLNTQMNTNSLTCTTIPRATKAVDVNCEVESQKIIALQPYVATFTHSVKVVFGSISKYINASGNLQDSEVKLTNPTITFNVPTSFYGQFTGQNQSQNNGIEVRTYNGNTQIGDTQYGKLTVSCNETKCRPSISGTVTDSNTTTSALTSNINKLVKYYSTAYLNLTLNPTSTSGDSNTTITSRNVDGTSFSGTTYSIANATKSSFNVTLTNSRGYSNTVTVSATGGLVDYFKPKVIAEFSRTSQTADTVQVKYSVDIFNGSFGSQTNKVTVKAQVYQNDAWTDINTLNTDSTSDIATTTVTLSGSYVYTSNFNFRLVATDLLDTTYVAQLVTAGVPNFSHGKGWFQHHTDVYLKDGSKLDGTLEVHSSKNYTDISYFLDDFKTFTGYKVHVGYITLSGVNNMFIGFYQNYNNGYGKVLLMSHYKTYEYKLSNGVWIGLEEHSYQTNETVVGYWHNGKAIYRKVVSFNPSTSALETSYAHGISNIDEILPTSSCILHRANGNFVPFAMAYPANATNILAWSIGWQVSRTSIVTWIGENMRNQIDTTNYGAVAIIEYTKTS